MPPAASNQPSARALLPRATRQGSDRLLAVLLAAVLALLLASGLQPFDHLTWFLETLPVWVVLPLLWATRRSHPLTPLLYATLALSGVMLIAGGAYSYARVPLGAALQDWLGLLRNPYDRIGHFVQGVVPALAVREWLLRGGQVHGPRLLAFVVACTVLALSASYELVEWAAARALGQSADAFLGMQGDPWDTQADMLCALLGAVAALVLLPRWHDRQLATLGRPCMRSGPGG